MRQIRQNVINKFETLIVCLRNRHCRNPQSHDFFSCYGKVLDVKCQLAFYHKVLWKTKLKQMGKKIGVHMPTIHRFTCQAFTDAVVLNVYPQFRDRSLYTTWGEWGEEFGRFWSRCHGKNLPDIPQTGFIIFLWFPSHCHLIDNQFSVVPPSPFILCWRLLIPIKSPPLDKWRLRRLVSVRYKVFWWVFLSTFAWPARVLIRPFTGQQKRIDHVCDEGI